MCFSVRHPRSDLPDSEQQTCHKETENLIMGCKESKTENTTNPEDGEKGDNTDAGAEEINGATNEAIEVEAIETEEGEEEGGGKEEEQKEEEEEETKEEQEGKREFPSASCLLDGVSRVT